MRVLHLIDASSPQATSTTLALVAASLGQLEHTTECVALLGGTSLTRSAANAGIEKATTIGVPYGIAVMGWSHVRRYARRHGPFDLIHCWSVGSLSLASTLLAATPRVLTLTVRPPQRTVRWIRTLSREARRQTVLLPISSTIRQTLLSGGVREPIVHVLRPGIDMGRVRPNDRSIVRDDWNAQCDHVKVMALLGDPPHAADSTNIATAMIITASGDEAADCELRLLVHPDQVNRNRLERSMNQVGLPLSVIQEPRLAAPWSVLTGCDVALALGPNAGGLSLLWAMAANIPIIGEATYAVSEIVEDHHSALLTQPRSATGLAYRMMQLLGDPQLAWKLRDTARHEAYSFFSCQHYRRSLNTVYQQIVDGRNVQVPELEASGGLRFAGRA